MLSNKKELHKKLSEGMNLNKEDYVKLVVSALAVAALVWLSLTSGIQGKVLGVVFLAFIIWSLYPERYLQSSIVVIVLLVIFEASLNPQDFIASLFSTYGGSGLWILLAGFVLAKGMESSGLAKRIALIIATSLGGNPRGIILAIGVASFAIAPLSPSTTAKAFLMLPICTGLIEAFGVQKGRSGFGASLMLVAMASNNICSTRALGPSCGEFSSIWPDYFKVIDLSFQLQSLLLYQILCLLRALSEFLLKVFTTVTFYEFYCSLPEAGVQVFQSLIFSAPLLVLRFINRAHGLLNQLVLTANIKPFTHIST
jgi:hypothetical protein